MRRFWVGVAAMAVTSALAVSPAAADPAADAARLGHDGFDRPWHGFAPPDTVQRAGAPADIGLDPAPITAALDSVRGWTQPGASGHPMFAGAVTLLAHDGVVVTQQPVGYALRYADAAGTELPPDQRVPMAADTIFDLASLSKLFTSIAVMQQVEAGRVAVDQPVVRYLPEFAVNGKGAITVRQLLTHTSGLAPDPVPSLWQGYPDIPSRRAAILASTPINPPGSTYLYSDINLMTLGLLVERVSGHPLDELVRTGITEPLGMTDTGYNPPASELNRIAATEFQVNPPRGMVRGQVHDENAWALGGVAGHAGVFSTAHDLAVLGQTVLNGGTYGGHRILRPDSVRQMLTNYNQQFPGDEHGLGFELDQQWYMGALSSPETAGHTGYTGTTLVIDPLSRSIAILLTNRVHPSRSWGSINPARRAVATGLADALAVHPRRGPDAWTASLTGPAATLTTGPLTARSGRLEVTFDAFVDVSPGDSLALQTSADGVTWQPVPVRVTGPDAPDADSSDASDAVAPDASGASGAPTSPVTALSGYGHRRWWRVSAELPGDGQVRWVFTRGGGYQARGVYLDDLRVRDGRGTVLDAERHPEALTAQGWTLASR
jgi:CubicO group peptidase (beta-lactamase class C family)